MTEPIYHEKYDSNHCAECGKELTLKDHYLFMYHFLKEDETWSLFVCEECHQQEIIKRALERKEESK